MSQPYPTIVFGLGRIGMGYAEDPLTSRYYPYATHAQVLRDHPAFNWLAAVDSDRSRCNLARDRWQVPEVSTSLANLPHRDRFEVAILATPPDERLALIEQLPNLKAVLVEKPLATSLTNAEEFVRVCQQRQIALQVNLWRRADERFRDLATAQLASKIGSVQTGHILYGNGFLNNGTHAVDFLRMFLGEVDWVQATLLPEPERSLPIAGDANLAGSIGFRCGAVVTLGALDFQHYREFRLDLWGKHGWLSVASEGLDIRVVPRVSHRAILNEWELGDGEAYSLTTTVGYAFYRLYDNLAESLVNGADLWSSGESALSTARVVDACWRSSQFDSERVWLTRDG